MRYQFEGTILEAINNAVRTVKAAPLVLGSTPSGGGGPPGGFVGFLPQRRVSFDPIEAEEWAIPESGVSLLTNLNRIRYRISALESGGGASTFLDLSDTPSSYIGFSGMVVAVTGGEDGLEFVPAGAGIPGGDDGDIQYNGSGEFLGISTFRRNPNGSVNIGTTSPALNPQPYDINQGANDSSVAHLLQSYGSNVASYFTFFRARGDNVSPDAVVDNDVLGRIRARAFDGLAFPATRAEIRFLSDGDWSTSSHPTRIEIWTTASGQVAQELVATIDNFGLNLESGKSITIGGAPQSGTYTPNIVASNNLTSSSVNGDFMYSRNGNIVTVAGSLNLDYDGSGTATIDIDLPITSNFTAGTDAAGNGTQPTNANGNGSVTAVASTSTVRLSTGTSMPTGTLAWRIVFMYVIK